MEFSILFLILLFALASGFIPGLIALMLSIIIFLYGEAEQLSLSNISFVILIVSSLPISAYLAGIFLDKFSFKEKYKTNIFSIISISIATFILIYGGFIFNQIELLMNLDVHSSTALVAKIISTTIFTASLSAVVLMLLVLLIELPVRFINKSFQASYKLEFAALRPLFVIMFISIGFNFIVDLYINSYV